VAGRTSIHKNYVALIPELLFGTYGGPEVAPADPGFPAKMTIKWK